MTHHFSNLNQNFLDKFIVNALFDKEPACCDAVLSLVEKDAAHTLEENSLHKKLEMNLNFMSLTKRTALSRSQSEKMMNGDFPPNSRDVFFKLESAQARMTIFPVSVLPVKPNLRTTGCSAIHCPMTLPVNGQTCFENWTTALFILE